MSSSTQENNGEEGRRPDPFGPARVSDGLIITGRDAAAGNGSEQKEPGDPKPKEKE